QHMLRHFIGKFYNNEKLNDAEYKISTHNWNKIGKIMEDNRKMMPLEFGRPPINIQKYYNSFKAKDWYNWTVLYLLPLFQNHLPTRHINGWAKFVRAIQLCLEPAISKEELREIKVLFVDFIKYYECMGDMAIPNRKAMWNVIPLVHSQQNPYTNLTKQVASEMFQINEHPFNPQNNEKKLYSLFKEHVMTKTEIRKIKQYYATVFDLSITCIKKYGKLQTKFRVIIGSQFSNHKGDISRNNYSIVAKLLINKNAHRPRAPIELEEQEFYGQVLFYFTHKHEGEISKLAYVHWVRSPEVYVNNIQYFHSFGEMGVININTIDRFVGFLKIATNKYVIIDRENWVIFR
ncbi:12999_t:CDS:2, partial [Gigaspora rosea]